MLNLLNVQNGKKTLLGLVGLLLFIVMAVVALLTGIDIPNFTEPTSWADFTKIVLGLIWGVVSVTVTGVGVADKVAKTRTQEMKENLLKEFPILSAADDMLKTARNSTGTVFTKR